MISYVNKTPFLTQILLMYQFYLFKFILIQSIHTSICPFNNPMGFNCLFKTSIFIFIQIKLKEIKTPNSYVGRHSCPYPNKTRVFRPLIPTPLAPVFLQSPLWWSQSIYIDHNPFGCHRFSKNLGSNFTSLFIYIYLFKWKPNTCYPWDSELAFCLWIA